MIHFNQREPTSIGAERLNARKSTHGTELTRPSLRTDKLPNISNPKTLK